MRFCVGDMLDNIKVNNVDENTTQSRRRNAPTATSVAFDLCVVDACHVFDNYFRRFAIVNYVVLNVVARSA